MPVPLVVTAEPPDPVLGGTVECVGAGEDDAGGVLLAGGDVAALWVTVAVLWAGLVVFAVFVFFTAWCWTVRSAGLGTVAIEATVALPC